MYMSSHSSCTRQQGHRARGTVGVERKAPQRETDRTDRRDEKEEMLLRLQAGLCGENDSWCEGQCEAAASDRA